MSKSVAEMRKTWSRFEICKFQIITMIEAVDTFTLYARGSPPSKKPNINLGISFV